MERVKGFWRRRRKAVIATVVAAAALGGFKAWRARAGGESAPGSAEKVAKGVIEQRFKESGDVAPKVYVDVASKVSGRVIEMSVDEGRSVAQGQALAVIQPGRTESERYVPSTVAAPIAGIVMRYVSNGSNNRDEAHYPRIGDYVTGLFDSQTPTYLMTIADMRRMIVRMQISEMDILKLRPAMPVSIAVDALPEKTFAGRVGLVAPQAEKNNAGIKVFKVEVELDQHDPRLRPGMTARVDALLESRQDAVKVPLSTVFEERGRSYVYTDEREPRKLELELGLRGELEAELVKGDVKPGMKLRTEKPADAAEKAWWSKWGGRRRRG